mmetsp:Transcript_3126/g.10300  ORF Transcript_3126/g.10300 Transcript_3126/m.10300 type:complete len:212 (-) Transcript_3126:811-1446(-)
MKNETPPAPRGASEGHVVDRRGHERRGAPERVRSRPAAHVEEEVRPGGLHLLLAHARHPGVIAVVPAPAVLHVGGVVARVHGPMVHDHPKAVVGCRGGALGARRAGRGAPVETRLAALGHGGAEVGVHLEALRPTTRNAPPARVPSAAARSRALLPSTPARAAPPETHARPPPALSRRGAAPRAGSARTRRSWRTRGACPCRPRAPRPRRP